MTLISKSQLSSRLGFRASPFQNPWSHITLAMWIRVRVTRDAHIIRVWGMGMPISLWQRHVAYIEAWAQYPCGRSELKLACVAGGFDSASERPSRKENGAGVCFEINGSRWTMYLEQSYQEIPDKLGFHMMLRIMQIWEVDICLGLGGEEGVGWGETSLDLYYSSYHTQPQLFNNYSTRARWIWDDR